MVENQEDYEQRIEYGRGLLWAPCYAVGMTVRIRGDIPTVLLRAVLGKLQTLHPPLASRVWLAEDGAAWLTTKGVGEFPLEVRPRMSDDDWIGTFLEQEKLPFAFDSGPVARFILFRGEQSSDLMVVAPHVVCDGYSMTHVMFDAMALLNNPGREVRRPSPLPTVTWRNVPAFRGVNSLLRAGARVLYRVWPGGRAALSYEDYLELHRRFWAQQENGMLAFGPAPAETAGLIARCKQERVSVNSALSTAFLLARADVQPGSAAFRPEVLVAINIRDLMARSPGTAVGLYSSSIAVHMPLDPGKPFWELARECHARIQRALSNRNRVLRAMVLNDFPPAILDAFWAGADSAARDPTAHLLSYFVRVRGPGRCLAISNIGRIDLPMNGSTYRMEALLPLPPLVPGDGMALNVLTIGGKMMMILKFEQRQMDGATAARITDRALEYLSGA